MHGTLTGMSRRGRNKGLIVIREPSGRRARSISDDTLAPAEVRRLRDAAARGLRDPEWGTELGRLYLQGHITAAMYGAAKWWREMAAEYIRAINAPSPDPRALGLERGSLSHPPDPESAEGRRQIKRERDAVRDFQAAHGALLGAGKLAEVVTRRMCEEDQAPIGYFELTKLQEGLTWLVNYRVLTSLRKSAMADR